MIRCRCQRSDVRFQLSVVSCQRTEDRVVFHLAYQQFFRVKQRCMVQNKRHIVGQSPIGGHVLS